MFRFPPKTISRNASQAEVLRETTPEANESSFLANEFEPLLIQPSED